MSLGVFSPIQLLEDLEKAQYRFFFVCLIAFTSEGIWSWGFVYREFILIITDSISLLDIGLFKLPVSS